MDILPNSVIRRHESALFSEIGESIVMMNVETGDYLDIQDVAADIWRLLEGPMTPSDMVEKLSKTYNVTPADCLADVSAFLAELWEENLIVVDD